MTPILSVATTLAELHRRGLIHANLAPEHIIVGPERRQALLCSPAPVAAGRSPDVDLAGLASIADSYGAVADRPAVWSTVVENLASGADMTTAAELFAALTTPRSARLRRRLGQPAPLQSS